MAPKPRKTPSKKPKKASRKTSKKASKKPSSSSFRISPIVRKAIHTTRSFSPKGSGIMAGGGMVTLRSNSAKEAVRILSAMKTRMAFWQVSRSYHIKARRRRSQKVVGYSQVYKRNMITETNVLRALDDSAINAANSVGFNFKYEGAKPDFVIPVTRKSFQILIWFDSRQRQTFLKLSSV